MTFQNYALVIASANCIQPVRHTRGNCENARRRFNIIRPFARHLCGAETARMNSRISHALRAGQIHYSLLLPRNFRWEMLVQEIRAFVTLNPAHRTAQLKLQSRLRWSLLLYLEHPNFPTGVQHGRNNNACRRSGRKNRRVSSEHVKCVGYPPGPNANEIVLSDKLVASSFRKLLSLPRRR